MQICITCNLVASVGTTDTYTICFTLFTIIVAYCTLYNCMKGVTAMLYCIVFDNTKQKHGIRLNVYYLLGVHIGVRTLNISLYLQKVLFPFCVSADVYSNL